MPGSGALEDIKRPVTLCAWLEYHDTRVPLVELYIHVSYHYGHVHIMDSITTTTPEKRARIQFQAVVDSLLVLNGSRETLGTAMKTATEV